jgi:hypothetical protein
VAGVTADDELWLDPLRVTAASWDESAATLAVAGELMMEAENRSPLSIVNMAFQ